ncbi:hypothetical protein SAMN05216382_2443 [Sphingomonas palmae]|uniref:Uncharacterized protein n=1 Tax=Sphingomonas palmae TaxID=1855283 RepID=A0A1H7S775_9SPHN|nr:hypothetical protein SAMN05216382_2443 [Sphingomonas palmae]
MLQIDHSPILDKDDLSHFQNDRTSETFRLGEPAFSDGRRL